MDTKHIVEQDVRAYIAKLKREIEVAERAYDIPLAVDLLRKLASPLVNPDTHNSQWKTIYLKHFYPNVIQFLLTYVAIHLENAFTSSQRYEAFEIFFQPEFIPVTKILDTLITNLTYSNRKDKGAISDETSIKVTEDHCIRLLENLLSQNSVFDSIFYEHLSMANEKTSILYIQHLAISMTSLPDVVYNRKQRQTPPLFNPTDYFKRLGAQMFYSLEHWKENYDKSSQFCVHQVFRIWSERFIRVGQTKLFVMQWTIHYRTSKISFLHSIYWESIPSACIEALLRDVLIALTKESQILLHALPLSVCQSSNFQFVLAQKIILKLKLPGLSVQSIVQALFQQDDRQSDFSSLPILPIFDTVLKAWSQDTFAQTIDYDLDYSIVLFLRLTMRSMLKLNNLVILFKDHNEWVSLVCKGVQSHMDHPVLVMRVLGMRVGETLSHIISPENLLSFEIEEKDPIVELEEKVNKLSITVVENEEELAEGKEDMTEKNNIKKKTKEKKAFTINPDDIIGGSDSEDIAESDSDSNSDSSSDTSLEAYDLSDDESDLKPKKPLYLKDLITALQKDDDRDLTETALAEAETLIRKRPRDLYDQTTTVLKALLRLEDKYSTPEFHTLRFKAIAACCALAPAPSLSILQPQAMEKEQMFQTRLDCLAAMVSAAQELSQTGTFTPKIQYNHEDRLALNSVVQDLKTRRWGQRRRPLEVPKKNAFGDLALQFFAPVLFGYINMLKELENPTLHHKRFIQTNSPLPSWLSLFLAHVLHTLAKFLECSGHSPSSIPMAQSLLEFLVVQRKNTDAAVRRQVIYAFSRVIYVVPSFLLRQNMNQYTIEMIHWMQDIVKNDPDHGTREAANLLLSSGAFPAITMP